MIPLLLCLAFCGAVWRHQYCEERRGEFLSILKLPYPPPRCRVHLLHDLPEEIRVAFELLYDLLVVLDLLAGQRCLPELLAPVAEFNLTLSLEFCLMSCKALTFTMVSSGSHFNLWNAQLFGGTSPHMGAKQRCWILQILV